MLITRHSSLAAPASDDRIDSAPRRTARVRTIGNSVRKFRDVELRVQAGDPEAGHRLVAVATIDKLRCLAVRNPSGTLVSAPPSPFVLFVL